MSSTDMSRGIGVPRKVLYLDHTSKISGGEIALFNLACALDKSLYFPIVVLAADGPLADRLRIRGIECHVMPLEQGILDTRKDNIGLSSLLRIGQLASIFSYALRLSVWAKSRRIDIIHANSLKADLYGALIGKIAGIPVIWHIRDTIDSNYLPRFAPVFRFLAGIAPNYIVANSQNTLRCLNLSRRMRSAVVYSGVDTEEPPECEAKPTSRRVRSNAPVPAGTDTDESEQVPASDEIVFVLVGRIASWKGQHIFIRAAAKVHSRYPQARFRIVGAPLFGEDAYEAELHDLVQTLGARDYVEFLGFRSDVRAVIASSDVLVHASTLGEPFGQVVVEGMAEAKPVIATDGGGLPEIVVPGVTGVLVPMGNSDAMAQAMCDLADNPALRRSMGEAGKQRVIEHFTVRHAARKIEAVYAQILGGG